MENILKELLQQESELQFVSFNEETAYQIGTWLFETARDEDLPIAIDITCVDRQLFHACRPGASLDNEEWIKRKIRVVRRFGHSSFYKGQNLKSRGKTIEETSLLSESEYAPRGGCFPIILKNTGIIGTITVSGLPEDEDHKLVVRAIRNYLDNEK